MSGPRQFCLNVQSHVAQLYLYQQCAVPTLISNSCSLCPLTHGKHEMIGLVLHPSYSLQGAQPEAAPCPFTCISNVATAGTCMQISREHTRQTVQHCRHSQFEPETSLFTLAFNKAHSIKFSSSDSCRHCTSGTSHILSGTRVGQYQGLKLSVTALYLQQPSHNPAGSNEAGSELICCGTQRVKAQSA